MDGESGRPENKEVEKHTNIRRSSMKQLKPSLKLTWNSDGTIEWQFVFNSKLSTTQQILTDALYAIDQHIMKLGDVPQKSM